MTGTCEIPTSVVVSDLFARKTLDLESFQEDDTLTARATSVMHRADYQQVLADEARRLGARFRLGADVVGVDCDDGCAAVTLASGERLTADVVVGADGLRGNVRTFVLGYVKEPESSGDFAYRVTIPREKLENDPDPFVRSVVNESVSAVWCWLPGPLRSA
jgi:salicylate hydroxylase